MHQSLVFAAKTRLDGFDIGSIIPHMTRANLVLHEKQIEADGSIIEVKIWSVPPVPRGTYGIKYSLVYIRDGQRVLGFDNSHGYHHRHYRGESGPYRFTTIQTLLRNFRRDVDRIRREEAK